MLAAVVSIGVLTLFQPRELTIETSVIELGGERLALSGPVHVRAEGRSIVCRAGSRELRGPLLTGTGPAITITIPNRMRRSYEGKWKVSLSEGILYPVIYMDLEHAVGRVVAAEMPSARLEAQKAQAIAARSYYQAGTRHTFFDFCDTTHCQAQFDKTNAIAPRDTAAQLLRFHGRVLRGLYFRSCSGRTLTAAQVRWRGEEYAYHSVLCEVCRTSPRQWSRKLPPGATAPQSEQQRLALGRAFGWDTLPSNTFEVDTKGMLHGSGEGHGVGLCQRGAAGLAAKGWDARSILRHYFPGVTVGP